jgi:glutamate N-acetyltransferase/amino-acid N-acetyltransferase
MGTMLAFLTTDCAISASMIEKSLVEATNISFNRISVDGDTSTNDMLTLMANGVAGNDEITETGEDYQAFSDALNALCIELAKKIAADGEGATKRVEVNVRGAKTEADAQLAAKAVANSNLTKCALFGNDPNWGRIACAVGYSGAKFSKQRMSIDLCGIRVFNNLQPVAFDQKKAHASMKKKVVAIDIDLGLGDKTATAHTCDFSYDYVKINAEYHT